MPHPVVMTFVSFPPKHVCYFQLFSPNNICVCAWKNFIFALCESFICYATNSRRSRRKYVRTDICSELEAFGAHARNIRASRDIHDTKRWRFHENGGSKNTKSTKSGGVERTPTHRNTEPFQGGKI